MPALIKFQDFAEQVDRAIHNFGTHVFKIALTNTAPIATQTTWNITDHPPPAAVNGYTAGGPVVTVSIAETGGVSTVQGVQVDITATTGGIGPYRYAVLYNSSAAAAVVSFYDKGASETLGAGEILRLQFGGASPGTIYTRT